VQLIDSPSILTFFFGNKKGFAAEGRLIADGFSTALNYTYNILQDNINGRTIKGFSSLAKETMYTCVPNCPFDDYRKFAMYYGEFDYADQWVTAAFDGRATDFDNGNADFRIYGEAGKIGKEPWS
jgi:hypothetical protein